MADADVQGMLIRIEATTAQLRQEIARGDAAVAQSAGKIDTSLGRIDGAFDRTGANAGALQKAVSSAFTGIGFASAAAVAGLVAITAKTTSYAQEVKNLSSLSNSSVTDFQRLAAGAKTVGIEQDKLGDILKDTSDRVGEFIQRGGGEMADFFKEIAPKVGVTAKMFANLSGPEALQLYYNSLEKAGLNQAQMTTYMEAMADEATALIPLLKNNGEGFKTFGDRAERTGQILKSIEIDQLVEVDQSIKALEGSFEGATRQLVLGMLPGIESVTDRLTSMSNNGAMQVLGEGVGFLADHLNILAAVMGAKVTASFVGYVQSLGASAVASSQARAANLAQAASAVETATANQIAAQSAVVRAEREAIAARGTAVQTQMSIQLAEARMAERTATAQLAAAQTGLKGASGGLLGLLGGPAGIAALAIGAGIAFLTMRDNTSLLEKKLGDLADPLDKLTERFTKLNRASQAVTMRELQASIADTQAKIGQMSGAMADKFEIDLRNMGAGGADGLMAGLVSLPKDVQAALDLVRKTSKDQAAGMTVDWKAVADQLRQVPGVTEEMAQALESGQAPVTDLSAVLQKQQQTLAALTAETDRNTDSQHRNTGSKEEASAAGKTYIDTLTKALHAAQDKTAVEAANRFISENTDLTKDQIAEILKLASAKDAQKKADDAATQATKDSGSATKKAANEEESRRKALTDLKAQIDIAVASATGLAAAYLAGTDKSREFSLQQKVEEALLKTGAGARAEVEKALKAQQDAQDKLNISKAAYDLGKETEDLLAQAKATLMGADALAVYNVQKSMTIALAGKNIEAGSKEYEQLLAATKAQQDAVKVAQQAASAGSIMDRLYPEQKLLREYTEGQAALNKAMELAPEKVADYQAALVRLGLEYEQNKNAATAWGQFTEGAVDRVDSAFADAWKNIDKGFSGFASSLKDGFKQLLAELAHMAITKPIIMQIGASLGVGGLSAQSSGLFGGSSGGGTDIFSLAKGANQLYSVANSGFGQAISSGWASGDGLFGGLQNAFSGGYGYVGSALGFGSGAAGAAASSGLAQGAAAYGSQFGTGIGTVSFPGAASGAAGGAASGAASAGLSGLGAAGYGIGGAIAGYQQAGVKGAVTGAGGAVAGAYAGAAIGSVVPIIGTAIGAAIGAVLGGMLGSSVWGGDWVTKDQGIQLGVTNNEFVGKQYEYQKKKGGLFSSNKKRTRLSALDPEMQAALDATYDATESSVLTLFDRLNVELSDGVLDGLNVASTKISTKGKTGEEIQEAITKWFGGVADSMVSAVDAATGAGLGGMSFEGLTSFVNNLYTANVGIATLGLKMLDFSVAGGFAAENLINMAGGIEALNTNLGSFYDNFTSDTQKTVDSLAGVRAQFVQMGVALPETEAAYKALLKQQDVSTEAGRTMLTILTANAQSAASAYAILNQRQSDYYSAFYSEAENTARTIAETTAQIKEMGVTLPDSRDGFRAMVEALDRTTVTGKAMYDTLMSVAGAAGTVFDALDRQAAAAQAVAEAAAQAAEAAAQALADKLMGAVTGAQGAVQRAISAQQKAATDAYNATTASLNDMASAASSNISDLTSVGNDLSSALKALRGDSDDAVKMLQAQARATLQNALATARSGGSLSGFIGLSDALDTVSSNNTDLYGSMEDFARDQGRTANVITELEGINGKQLTSAEATLKTLKDQIDLVKDQFDQQMDVYDQQLEFAQAQLDAINGTDNSIKSVVDAINAMNASVVAALGAISFPASSNTPQNNGSIVDTLYQSVLGRSANDTTDAAGKAQWAGALQNGSLSYADAAKAIAEAALAFSSVGYTGDVSQGTIDSSKAAAQKYLDSIKGFSTGGLISGPGTGTSDSILSRLSNGEYVMTADAVRMFGTGLLDQMNAGQLPAFATGGGIGESGPQLEVTGPSRIYNANQTASMLRGGGDSGATAEEVRGLRRDIESNATYMAKLTKAVADGIDTLVNSGVQINGTVETKAVA
ncbi:hypothetical protein [Pseudomonas helleri]|uniref:hypothetical protein n=1 Tax=Pseudomonas helleri TaxID=1608996 RepID=UPI003F98ADE2